MPLHNYMDKSLSKLEPAKNREQGKVAMRATLVIPTSFEDACFLMPIYPQLETDAVLQFTSCTT